MMPGERRLVASVSFGTIVTTRAGNVKAVAMSQQKQCAWLVS